MTLENFRAVNLKIDRANGSFLSDQFAKAGDYNGRRLVVQLSNAGVVGDLTGVDVNLGWQHDTLKNTGLDPFEPVDLTQGIFEIYYPKEMLTNGNVTALIQIIENDHITETKNFKIKVEKSVIDEDTIVSENSFTVLQDALLTVNRYDSRIANVENSKVDKSTFEQSTNNLTAQLQHSVNGIKPNHSVWTEFEQRSLNVKWFGAKGDGLTDDTTTIQSAINFVQDLGGGVIFFPTGEYLVSDTLLITKSNVWISGNGLSSRIILSDTMSLGTKDAKWTIEAFQNVTKTTQQMLTNGNTAGFLVKKGEVWIGVQDANQFAVGDLVHIAGDFSTSPWTSQNRGTAVKGETNYVIDLNTTTNKIRLLKGLSDDWTTSEIATVKCVEPLKEIKISDLSIIGGTSGIFRGTRLQNCFAGVVENCHIKNTAICGIESYGSYKNLINNNVVTDAWAGDIKTSDLASTGLGYGIRAVNDTMTTISLNRINHARHVVDISGGYPSRLIHVIDNVGTQLTGEYGNFSSHGPSESCVFRGNIANGGQFGFVLRGENTIVENNITRNTDVSVYCLAGRNFTINNNDFDGHLLLTQPDTNDNDNFLIVKNNVFKGTASIAYLISFGTTNFEIARNYNFEGNSVFSTTTTVTGAFNTAYAGVENVLFDKSLIFKNNFLFISKGKSVLKLALVSDMSKVTLDRWSPIQTDSLCVVNVPTSGLLGEVVFLKDVKKPVWYDGEKWLDANGYTAKKSIGNTTVRNNLGESSLIVGESFFDTTLGKPLYVKSLSPIVWVDAVGTVV